MTLTVGVREGRRRTKLAPFRLTWFTVTPANPGQRTGSRTSQISLNSLDFDPRKCFVIKVSESSRPTTLQLQWTESLRTQISEIEPVLCPNVLAKTIASSSTTFLLQIFFGLISQQGLISTGEQPSQPARFSFQQTHSTSLPSDFFI